MAQVALDCDLRGGTLAPMRGHRLVGDLGRMNPKTIYKFGYKSGNEMQWWFAFENDIDVAKAAISNDTEERTYFSGVIGGLDIVRKTRFGLAQSGTAPYPTNYLEASVPKPTSKPAFTTSGGDGKIEPEYVIYTETFVTEWDEESEPGPASDRVSTLVGATNTITNLTPLPSGSTQINRRRIYRSSYSGNLQTGIQFVAEIPVAQTTYVDSKTKLELGETLKTQGWDAWPEGIRGLRALWSGMTVGFKDYDVYFGEPLSPYAAPLAYSQATNDPIVGIGSFGTALVVLTKGAPLTASGGHPDDFVLAPAEVLDECSGCASKRGIVSVPGAVFYPNEHGIVMLSPSSSQLLTAAYVQKNEWKKFAPDTMLGITSGSRYIGFYDNGLVKRGLIFDPNVVGFTETTAFASAAHVTNGKLYLAMGSKLMCFEEGDLLPYTWKSRKWVLPSRANLSVGRVLADSYPVTLKLFADGALVGEKTVQSNEEFTMPSGYTAFEFEVQVEGVAKVRRVTLAETSDELQDIGA
ncbi:hypothetical protein [Variovorax sp. 278MFTsu5.1]|uniref:hypothetical protein n=1 Tax=Variovorax sp. 278MFTsu5.1 TaxID=3158366 RepID=UPI003AAD1B39